MYQSCTSSMDRTLINQGFPDLARMGKEAKEVRSVTLPTPECHPVWYANRSRPEKILLVVHQLVPDLIYLVSSSRQDRWYRRYPSGLCLATYGSEQVRRYLHSQTQKIRVLELNSGVGRNPGYG